MAMLLTLLEAVEERGLKPDVISYRTILLRSRCRCCASGGSGGAWAEARCDQLQGHVVSASGGVISCRAMLLTLLEATEERGLKPDVISYRAMLWRSSCRCCVSGDNGKAWDGARCDQLQCLLRSVCRDQLQLVSAVVPVKHCS